MKNLFVFAFLALTTASSLSNLPAAELRAGIGKVEITDRIGLVNDPCFAKALVLKNGDATRVLITVDAVAIGEIEIMAHLTRLNTNLALLKKHLAQNKAAGKPTLDAEVCGLRVGDFKLVTFPGELTVQIALGLKKAFGDPHAFVAGCTKGNIYYTPTVAQRNNAGYAQEDCDCIVSPEWQKIFETKALEVAKALGR